MLTKLHPTILLLAALAMPTAAVAQDPTLKGNDPVLLSQGQEVAGKPDLTVQHGSYTYQFATEANRAAFRADPGHYEIQLGGGCARMGPLSGLGDSDRWLVHGGRIYIFASDQCRESFSKRPELFLDPDDPEPEPTAEAATRGVELLARAVAAHGGADRIKAVRTYRHERRVTKGDMTEEIRLQIALPGRFRADHDYLQGDKQWRYGHVVTPEAAFFVEQGKRREMHNTARREAIRSWQREPLVALRSTLDRKHVVAAGGKAVIAGVAVEQCELWIDGCSCTFGVGQDGRIRTACFRGRGPEWWFGRIELVFDDFAESGGVLLPATVSGTLDGKPSKALGEKREGMQIDGQLAPGVFEAPK